MVPFCDPRWKTARAIDPLTPAYVVEGIKESVAKVQRARDAVPDVQLKDLAVSKSPRILGMFEVRCTVEASGVTTHISITFDPNKGAWFQVGSVWDNGRKSKELDDHVAGKFQYNLLLDALLTHLHARRQGP